MVACVAGNPHKAWKVPIGADVPQPERDRIAAENPNAPDREPPDDVWEDQSYPFDELAAAKTFIEGLDPVVTTHVKLEYLQPGELDQDGSWVTIYDRDADRDHLADAGPDVPMPHTVDSHVATAAEEVDEAPAVMPTQGDQP